LLVSIAEQALHIAMSFPRYQSRYKDDDPACHRQ
jgi:hypothetical protein